MKMKRVCVLLLILVTVVGLSGVADADLTKIGTATYQGSDYNLIYEDDSIYGGLVWLDYTRQLWQSYNWDNQVSWASGLGEDLTVTLNPGYTTTIDWTTGWRLPATDESKTNFRTPDLW